MYNSPTCLVTKLVLVVKIDFVHYLLMCRLIIFLLFRAHSSAVQFKSMQKQGGVSGQHRVFAGGPYLHAVQMRARMFPRQQHTHYKQCASA